MGITSIRAAAVAIITGLSVTGPTFREAPYTKDLEALELASSPSETTRQFHCLPDPDAGVDPSYNACPPRLEQRLTVKVRYQHGVSDGRYLDLRLLAAEDGALITSAITSGHPLDGSHQKTEVQRAARPLRLLSADKKLWMLTLHFKIFYLKSAS